MNELYIYLIYMNEYEISKLKKELLRKNEVIREMKDDLEFVEKQLVTAQAERDKYHGELQIARHTIENVDQIIDQKVREMRTKLEHENANALNELQTLRDRLIEEKNLTQKYNEQIRNKDAVISQLSLRLRQMSVKYKDPSLQINVKEISEQASITYNQFYKLTEKYNRLSEDMENIMAENKILRKLHGVPDNFGFDLEEIKIAEKQELEDYKAQCRKLETEIEELEAERTQLRYRLRQYNTLYSNKGERYKDLTQRQLELLDAYALNLKDGKNELPQIDKSQKEMEREIIRLRAQIEVLQSKNPMMILPGSKQEQTPAGGFDKDALKKIELQIKGMLEPFVQDIKKLSDTNIVSLIQNIQNVQGDTISNTHISSNINPGAVSGLRPPIPLPIANNDWSTIKDGYSYRYACKIPIDLKDYEGEVSFDVVRAKYEIAALQLQNIESLKIIKEKQDKQNLIRNELNDLKQKFKKCLLVQDDLFVKYFKIRDEYKESSKQNDLQKRRITDQRDQMRSELSILKETLHTLTTKTDMETKFKDFGERLAKSQAGLVKAERKYQIIFDEHKYLRDAYTKMELKSAQNQSHLKAKYLNARKNEKQLTMLMNQILEQTKDSVSSDTHNLLLAKMETLNEKTAQSAYKQADLRIKISRLESVEREMNIKDEIIEYLREEKLDILLELEILKNRLKAIDPSYRQAFNVFERLIGFINQNSVSIMECFNKFDKDKSGTLTKSEYKTALDAFGFALKNEDFELLFNQFDLDGSGSLSYAEFMRKLKRSGAISRSADEQAIYLFFKGIKLANISIKKAFQFVDKDNSNSISKAEMQTAFRQMGIQSDSKTIDAIFRMTDGDLNGTITCQQLEKLYANVVKDTEIDEYELKPSLDWKYKFILKIEQASIKNKMTFQEAFKALDDDGNSYMTITELSGFLTKLGVYLENKNLNELFRFLDSKIDGKVEYGEFLKLLDEAKRQQRKVERLLAVQRRAEQLRKQNEVLMKQSDNVSKSSNQQAVYKIRMMALETKQNNLIKKNEKLCKSIANKEQQIRDLERTIQENERQLTSAQDKYTKERETNISLQQKMKNYIGEIEAKKLKQEHHKIKISNTELATQLETFKGLCSSLTDKNKIELMSVQKIKAELHKHYDIVKELQSQNINKAEFSRLVLELEYSKRNEEIVNKKYEDICEETKTLAKENNELGNQSLEKEKEIVNTYLLMKEKTNLMQKTIDSLTGKILPTVTVTKIDEITNKLRQISSSKSQLEEQNKALREKNFNLQLKYDHIEIEKLGLQELQRKLRKNYTDESSIALMDLTKQLSEYKMSELKTKREYNLLKEKEEYYMRINNANTDNIKELEVELGKWEVKFNEREEFWRKRMADQMKLADDIRKQVERTKQNEIKAVKYFNEKQIEDEKVENQYNSLSQQREARLSQFAKPPSVYRQMGTNNEKVEELKAQVNELTRQLQEKQREIYQLRSTLQDIVPEQKLKFSTIGSQIGGGNQARSFILQTDLTTSQLKSNARRFLNSQKDQQNFFREEAERMAQAAQHSIDTLQRIIDDKNEQIKRKDKIIDELKREMLKAKEEDCYEIQKLNEQIRQLRSKGEINSINQLMNKSTHKGFYPGGGNLNNDERIKSLMEVVDEKEVEIKNWERKYNELYINKSKVKPVENPNNKLVQAKLKELAEEREEEKKKYAEAEKILKEKIKNLEKLIKEKDVKLGQLHKTLVQLKEDVVNEKQQLSQENVKGNEEFIMNMTKGSTANDSKMEVMLQRAMETIQTMTKKNKEYEAQIKRLKEQTKLNKTMSRR